MAEVEKPETASAKMKKYPWIRIIFLDNSTEVEMGQWEQINARRLQKGLRAINKQRTLLKKQVLVKERQNA